MRRWPRRAAHLVTTGAFLLLAAPAAAGSWTAAYVTALPDDAFAAVALRPDGTRARALPHHDADGRVDGPHLRSAWSRVHQVKWLNASQAEAARRHLLEHLRQGAGGAAPP
jgi:hypothetical protein